jgi:quinol monooxygenase YgiN
MRFSLLHVGLSFCLGFITRAIVKRSLRSCMRAGFVLCVRLRFSSDSDKEEFSRHFKQLARAVMENEPSTLSFQLMEADNDPLNLLLFERFLSKDAYLSLHRGSNEFKRVKSCLQNIGCVLEGQSYIELGSTFGFMHQV